MKKLAEQIGSAVSGVIGLISGAAPHVLHHVGIFTSIAFFGGVSGSLVFGLLGLILALPFFIRLHRRFGTWAAPGIAAGIFAAAFLLSTFFIGPAIQNVLTPKNPPSVDASTTTDPPASGDTTEAHDAHHPDKK